MHNLCRRPERCDNLLHGMRVVVVVGWCACGDVTTLFGIDGPSPPPLFRLITCEADGTIFANTIDEGISPLRNYGIISGENVFRCGKNFHFSLAPSLCVSRFPTSADLARGSSIAAI